MSENKVTGQLTVIGEPQIFSTGSQKVQFVIKNNDGYEGAEKLYAFTYFAGASKADKIDKFIKFNHVGDTVEVKFNIECREYNGKYYTDLSAYSVFGTPSAGEVQREKTEARGADAVLNRDDVSVVNEAIPYDDEEAPF